MHRGFLALDALHQFELGAATVEVVVGAVRAEVNVAAQIIRQEPQPDLEGDELAGKGDERFLPFGQKRPGTGEVTAGERLEHGHLHGDLPQIQFVLEGGTGGGAHHVAEIIQGAPGHDGVEIDDAHGLAGDDVEHDIVELGVVVGDALGDVPLGQSVHDDADQRLAFQGEIDLATGAGRAVEPVVGQGALEGREALAGVVEVGDGLDEPAAGQVHEQALEFAEGLAGLERLRRRLDGFVGLDAFHIDEGAPDIAVAVLVERPAVAGGDDDEGAAGEVADVAGLELFPEVAGDAHEVLHDAGGVPEDGAVELLMDVTDAGAALIVGGGVGLVDVADLQGLGMEDLAVDLEVAANLLQLVFLIRHGKWERLKVET